MKLKTFLQHTPFEEYTEYKIFSINGDFIADGMTICGKASIADSPIEHLTTDYILERTVREVKAINRCELQIFLGL